MKNLISKNSTSCLVLLNSIAIVVPAGILSEKYPLQEGCGTYYRFKQVMIYISIIFGGELLLIAIAWICCKCVGPKKYREPTLPM